MSQIKSSRVLKLFAAAWPFWVALNPLILSVDQHTHFSSHFAGLTIIFSPQNSPTVILRYKIFKSYHDHPTSTVLEQLESDHGQGPAHVCWLHKSAVILEIVHTVWPVSFLTCRDFSWIVEDTEKTRAW